MVNSLATRWHNTGNSISSLNSAILHSCNFGHSCLSCSKLVISVTEHLVEVVDKLSTTAVVFFRSERILKCKHLYGA